MKTHILISLKMIFLLTFVTGFLYTFLVTAAAQLIFPRQANGSMIAEVGSELIGQTFTGDKYFWSRPSATDYHTLPSGASNLAMTSKLLQTTVQERANHFARKNEIDAGTKVPAEMVFASGSGLDPHISIPAAYLQVKRIAKARGMEENKINLLIEKLQEKRQFFILGEERINVLRLNLELDKLSK